MCTLWAVAPLQAQGAPASSPFAIAEGRVIRVGAADSAPAAGIRVVLHYIGRERREPSDSVLTGRDGRFRFRFPADTTALHILTARHAGIQYFADPLSSNPAQPDTNVSLFIHDTSSAAPVALEARHIVVSAPAEDGTRSVVELLSLRNDGPLARVARDTLSATWTMRVPPGAIGFAVSDGDLSAGAVDRNEDSVLVRGPIAPGTRQVSIEYLLPAGADRLGFPIDEATATVNLLLEEAEARVVSGELPAADSATVIQGRTFRRWTGPLAAGTVLGVELPRSGRATPWLLGALVAAVAGALLVSARAALRRPVAGADIQDAAPGPLIAALARLDADHAGRRADLPEEAWTEYQRARGELKARLAAALARRGERP